MSKVEKLLKERNIPDALTLKSGKTVTNVADFERRRAELKKILENEIYGVMPPKPDHLTVNLISEDPVFCAGKAPQKIRGGMQLWRKGIFGSFLLRDSEKRQATARIRAYQLP